MIRSQLAPFSRCLLSLMEQYLAHAQTTGTYTLLGTVHDGYNAKETMQWSD